MKWLKQLFCKHKYTRFFSYIFPKKLSADINGRLIVKQDTYKVFICDNCGKRFTFFIGE